jgi:hypothetical protein
MNPGAPVPLTKQGARGPLLQAVCRCAEGADVVKERATALAAALRDRARFCVLGGREGLPRSVGSIYVARVALFLGPCFDHTPQRLLFNARRYDFSGFETVLCFDGSSRIFTTDNVTSIYVRSAANGALLHTVSCFHDIGQACACADGFVFVADARNNRIVVLTPQLGFHGFVGEHVLDRPIGVCADADVVVVSEKWRHCIAVFRRSDGVLLRRFGSARGRDAGMKLQFPGDLCILSANQRVAVLHGPGFGVSVFTIQGALIRHISECRSPAWSIACSAFDELVVITSTEIRVYNSDGEVCRTVVGSFYRGVAVREHGILAIPLNQPNQLTIDLYRYA